MSKEKKKCQKNLKNLAATYIFDHNRCPKGPYLRLNLGAFKIHFLVKSLESFTDFFKVNPLAKLTASADEKVQPDP